MKGTKLTIGILALAAAIIFGAIGLNATAKDDVIASVNGIDITLSAFYEELEAQAGAFVLRQMIMDELIRQKQAEYNVVIEDEEFDKVFAQIVQQLGGQQGLNQFLQQSQATIEQLEEQIRWNLLVTKLSQAEVTITDEQIQEWFDEYREFYNLPEEVKASHILVDTEEEALALVERLNSGEDFAELAMEYSLDPGTGPRGGDLGYFERGMMVEAFENTAFSLAVGEIGVTESNFGWHIILVTDYQEAKDAELAEVYEEIKQTLLQQKAKSAGEYIQALEASAQVEIFVERYQK